MERILGLSGSLRNARISSSNSLCEDICKLDSQEELIEYLRSQSKILVNSLLKAGKESDQSFLAMYENLRSKPGDQGLSNSEAALACGLWAAAKEGCNIDYLSLSRHFPPAGKIKHEVELREKILSCDGLLISGPVYFGDRGSLVQSFIDYCYSTEEIINHLQKKIYAGISVGAKRNGGQETTLIYQMLDMANMGMLAVGNDTQTTSQYGGTVVAGDIGKLPEDSYGIETCISTGRRIAHASRIEKRARGKASNSTVRLHLILLQDSADRTGLKYYQKWIEDVKSMNPNIEPILWDVVSENVVRCIACDICPTEVGEVENYRCIISRKDDFFAKYHSEIIDADAILICAYSPRDRAGMLSSYQQFMERTRYLRRDNYIYSDLVVAPFVISELSARQNIHLRIMTSMVRHQTIISHPLIGMIHEGNMINESELMQNSSKFIDIASSIAQSHSQLKEFPDNIYNPIGYVLSTKKMQEDIESGRMKKAVASAQSSRKCKQSSRINIEAIK